MTNKLSVGTFLTRRALAPGPNQWFSGLSGLLAFSERQGRERISGLGDFGLEELGPNLRTVHAQSLKQGKVPLYSQQV